MRTTLLAAIGGPIALMLSPLFGTSAPISPIQGMLGTQNPVEEKMLVVTPGETVVVMDWEIPAYGDFRVDETNLTTDAPQVFQKCWMRSSTMVDGGAVTNESWSGDITATGTISIGTSGLHLKTVEYEEQHAEPAHVALVCTIAHNAPTATTSVTLDSYTGRNYYRDYADHRMFAPPGAAVVTRDVQVVTPTIKVASIN